MPFCVIIPCPYGDTVIAETISAKNNGGPSVVPFKIINSEGPFEVASFEHFGLERPFNMAAMIVFTSEGDISCLESTVDHAESECQIEMIITAAILSTLDTVNR